MELRKSERAKLAMFPFLITLVLLSLVRSKSLDEICDHGGELTLMYWEHLPYIMTSSNGEVSGIFPRFMTTLVKECCHSNVQLTYLQYEGPADFYTAVSEVKLHRSKPRFDIALPLHTAKFGKTSFETLPFIAIAESVGIAVLKHSNVSGVKLMTSLLQAWPVLMFIILTATIAGIVMWFVERQSNSKQFSPPFSRGAFDGFWWAFVSMTSVGYGDKYPKSIVGKFLGSCWLVIGMLFVSMFLGTLTTTTALLLEGTFDIQNEKISVVNGSVAHCLGIAHHATIKEMTKQGDLYQPLIQYKVDAALVDINSLKDVVDYLQGEYNIKVTGILTKETFYGIVLREVATNLTSCFQEYIEKHEFHIYRNMSQYSGTQKNKLDPAEDYFGSGGIFSISVYCMVAVLVIFSLSGCIWEYHKHRSLILMRNESNAEEFSCQEPLRNGRAPLGTSTSTDAFPSDCPCHMSDPFETVLEFQSRQSNV